MYRWGVLTVACAGWVALGAERDVPSVSDKATDALEELAELINASRSQAQGRSCETHVVRLECALRYRTTCLPEGAPETQSFWYEVTVPLAALDLAKVKTGQGLSDHPGHSAVRWVTRGRDLQVITGTGRSNSMTEAVLALGVGPDAVRRAQELPGLLARAAAACQ